jgi:hypothetical protein
MPSPEGLGERAADGRPEASCESRVSFGLQLGPGKSDTLSLFATPFPPEHGWRKRSNIERARGDQQCMSTFI